VLRNSARVRTCGRIRTRIRARTGSCNADECVARDVEAAADRRSLSQDEVQAASCAQSNARVAVELCGELRRRNARGV
jgi:hypothetical protein